MKQENASFISFDNSLVGLIFDDSDHNQYPLKYFNYINGKGVHFQEEHSYFIYCYSGFLGLTSDTGSVVFLNKGEFASIYGGHRPIMCWTNNAKAIVIELQNKAVFKENNYKAFPMKGGPIEETGRLKYIDGCTDSLLLSPVKKGDPCLNHLHFPPNIDQTEHTHPSHRIGIVASGHGLCKTPFGDLPLTEGMIFIIKEWDGKTYEAPSNTDRPNDYKEKLYPNGQHAFQTFDSVMNVIAFHPDSDFGPEDDEHPMINRTIVDGKSAKNIDEIRTQ